MENVCKGTRCVFINLDEATEGIIFGGEKEKLEAFREELDNLDEVIIGC